MDIAEFKRVLMAFADEPADIDVRIGQLVAQVRDDLLDVTLKYAPGPDRNLLVVEHGTSQSARSWLLNRVAKLPQLAERILAATSLSAAQLPFVTPEGLLSPDLTSDSALQDQCVHDAVKTLVDLAESPSPGATSVLYLTSDAGEGKTTVINRVARVQAERFKLRTASSLIVPIPLSGRAFLTFDDAVIAALVNKLRFNYLYFDAFIELVKMGAVVPAFDGYEEMLVEGSKGEAVSALGNLVQRLDSAGCVLIAARKAFFEYVSFKTQARLLDAIGDKSAFFTRLALQRWSRQQFCEYGRLREIQDAEGIYDSVASRLSPQHPLLTRAVFVRRLFDVASASKDKDELVALLGKNPHDYFYTFVDAIVKREASEKWLSHVSGDVMEPLLTIDEHHQLLSMIAQEMWQLSASSLRYDVLDAIVDLFSETSKKTSAAIRQVKERLRQHSLLSVDSSRGQALSFDHEDFQNFYLGEALGGILLRSGVSEIRAFLSPGLIPLTTIEQAVQFLVRSGGNALDVIEKVVSVNAHEAGFSFCKENCATLLLRTSELLEKDHDELILSKLYVSANALAERSISNIKFQNCHFQPTLLMGEGLQNVIFSDCEFERIEANSETKLSGCTFIRCRVDALLLVPQEDHVFDPVVIVKRLAALDATTDIAQMPLIESKEPDHKTRMMERFLRMFLRVTHVDEEFIRLRLGRMAAPEFFDEMLPQLLRTHVLEEVTWRGRGNKRRYKLATPMSEIDRAMEGAKGDFDKFLTLVSRA